MGKNTGEVPHVGDAPREANAVCQGIRRSQIQLLRYLGQLPIAGWTKKAVKTFKWLPLRPQIRHNILISFLIIFKARMWPRLAVRFLIVF